MAVIRAISEYLVEELAKDNPPIGTVIMGDVYMILIDQGSSRQEFLDACIDCEKAKTAFINRLIEKSGLAERIVKVAFNTIISTPSVSKLFKDCIAELHKPRER